MHFSKSTYIGAIACPKISLITDWGDTQVLPNFWKKLPGGSAHSVNNRIYESPRTLILHIWQKLINLRFKTFTVTKGLHCKQKNLNSEIAQILLRQSDFILLFNKNRFFGSLIVN